MVSLTLKFNLLISVVVFQRLVVNLDDPVGTSRRSTLLLKAVQDCFIGRHFIFGFKVFVHWQLFETGSNLLFLN